MSWDGEIEPATIEQVRRGKNGKVHIITEDAGGVAAGLRQIDPGLNLRYSEGGEHYVVYFHNPDTHRDELVKTYRECDQRIVHDVARIRKENLTPGYSFADQLEAQDRAADRAKDHAISEQLGEAGERLHHAINKDAGVKNRIVVPGE